MRRSLSSICAVAITFSLAACHDSSRSENKQPSIVGTWIVKMPEAPFPIHMFVFHADGTVQQSNPDAGDPNTSDSSAMGVWLPNGDGFKGKIVEITADRTTHHFASRGEIAFMLKVEGDVLHGTASAKFYDTDGRLLKGPLAATLDGQRVVP